MQIWPGNPYPLGASFEGTGTNFSLFSEVATRVELCLFDEHGNETKVDLPERTALCWHGYVPNIYPGQRYGFRVHGPWEPRGGGRVRGGGSARYGRWPVWRGDPGHSRESEAPRE